ncbi:hypothetical protein CEUSTIGMA_g676.t1 [Chlamydomonas eustigma]|uniref:RNA helicase n=1 Tax=Chlamydomonas eustigma TaxID=1157962 RepID=A0A250WQY3_9CHLO|nr:hypothetical protein CEUSTIGMA_g676.t1 [Chlamydomonas eustigma]|eukprot:GAX73223.1 hypothetical protein CEUSTIGMA_g676.t1 [Chlamydomonas eustigma]
MTESDFNPNFKFDTSSFEPIQSAWEFSGALEEAKKAQTNSNATSIDQKIQQRLQASKAFKDGRLGNNQHINGEDKRNVRKKSYNEEEEEEDDDNEEEEDDDEPLPGELDDDDGDDDGGEEEDDEEDNEGDDDEQEREEEDEAEDTGEEDNKFRGTDDAMEEESQEDTAPKKRQKTDAGFSGQVDVQHLQNKEQSRAAKTASLPGSTQEGFFSQTPEGTTFSAKSFLDLNLSRPLIKACNALGYAVPTPIQAACIPLALSGRDICGSAMTGSGKTAAFALPILERLLHRPRQVAATYVLILTPTRELAVQIHSMIQKLAQYTDVQAALIVGGLSVQVQASVLRKSPEIVVATPGRLIDHLRNTQSVGLEDLAVMVLDEADRLLEMGFKEEITEIVKMAPKKRQTMLFSATLSDQVRRLAALSLRQPVRLAADATAAVPRQLTQQIVRLKAAQAALKEAYLLAMCSRSFSSGHVIVFFRTKQRAHRAKILFGLLGLPTAAELHGDMTQAARLESLERFRQNQVAFLLATDVAARGLDISGVKVIVNYDAPKTLETYLHRIGRTARAGAEGQAITFIEDVERKLLKEVVKKTGVQMQQREVPSQTVQAWQAKVEGSHGDVWRVLKMEREEKELRQAEMEASKMQNMLEHEVEIKGRPARTWFQTERQKKEIKKKTAAVAAEGEDDDGVEEGEERRGGSKGSKEERKARKKAEHSKKVSEEDQRAKGKTKLAEETEVFSKAVKGVKSRVRELVQQGINPHKAAKMAAASITGVKRKAKGKDVKQKGESPTDKGLFSGDGINSSKVTGGKDSPANKAGKFNGKRVDSGGMVKLMSKMELNKLKRGGKGKQAFKSKARFKRKK